MLWNALLPHKAGAGVSALRRRRRSEVGCRLSGDRQYVELYARHVCG